MKSIIGLLAFMVFAASTSCCKDPTPTPNLCETQKRVRFYNGTEFEFEKIGLYDIAYNSILKSGEYSQYMNFKESDSTGLSVPLINISRTGYVKIKTNVVFPTNGCYTLIINKIDTLNVFADTTLDFGVIKD